MVAEVFSYSTIVACIESCITETHTDGCENMIINHESNYGYTKHTKRLYKLNLIKYTDIVYER